MYTPLHQTFSNLASIPQAEWLQFEGICSIQNLSKDQFFTQVGENSDRVAYLVSGLCRRFHTKPNGTEYTHNFYIPGGFLGCYAAILSQQPSNANIVAIEDSQLITFRMGEFKNFYLLSKCWETIGRKVAESVFIERERREYQLLMQSAQERYLNFRSQYPDLDKKLPNTMVASYLGITPETLSRLLKKL